MSSYIPVGTPVDAESLDRMSQQQLTQRTILDPRFAGYQADFRWEDHIDLHIKDNILRTRVIGSLNQFSKTPEGQHVIRQASAMSALREKDTVALSTNIPPAMQEKLLAIRGCNGKLTIANDGNNVFMTMLDAVLLNRPQIEQVELQLSNGQFRDMSVQGTLFHELAHAADGLGRGGAEAHLLTSRHVKPLAEAMATAQRDQIALARETPPRALSEGNLHVEARRMPEAKSAQLNPSSPQWHVHVWLRAVNPAKNESIPTSKATTPDRLTGLRAKALASATHALQVREQTLDPIIEFPAMRLTNEFMRKYYNEPDRAMNHSAVHYETANEQYVTPTALGGDHYYDTIKLPTKPKQPRQR